MIHQLNPTILVETPLGRGQTLFIIDYGMHQNTCWVVALEKNGVVKHFDCNDILIATNYTYHMNYERNRQFEEDSSSSPGFSTSKSNGQHGISLNGNKGM